VKSYLTVVICILALTVLTAGVALAQVNWDEDPVLRVGEQQVQVWFASSELASFWSDGGQILLTATAPDIELLVDSNPDVVTTVVQGGKDGRLALNAVLVGANAPARFSMRVYVPASGFEQVYTMSSGHTVKVKLP